MPHFLRVLCEKGVILQPRANTEDQVRRAGEVYQGQLFDVVHVFRLAAMLYAQPYIRQARKHGRLHLDLDDIESKTSRRIAELHRGARNDAMADAALANAQRSSALEAVAFRSFDRIYVCSDGDRRELADRCEAEICVLRNTVRLPGGVRPVAANGVFRFLFLGTLGYYPNQDGVRFFCSEVLPLMRAKAVGAFQVNVVGSGDSTGVAHLASGEVHLAGQVADVRPWYEDCNAVIVPLRVAGGTRVRILEAFSYSRPVVTTTIGLEGIDAAPDQHVLVANTPEDFAAACLKLMTDRTLAPALVENASVLVSRLYTVDALKETLALL